MPNITTSNTWIKSMQQAMADQKKQAGQADAKKVYDDAIASGKYEEALPIDPVTGRPLQPKWESMIDPATGLMKDQYLVKDQMDMTALNKFKGEALRDPGTQSAWAQLMNDKIAQEQTQAMDDGNRMIGEGRNALLSDLASSGGAGQGARERAFRNANRDSILSKQRTLRDATNRRGDVALQDEESRKEMLGQSVNMDAARANYMTDLQKTNTQNSALEVNAGRDWTQNRYNKEMEAWGAQKQAEAQKSGGSCFAGEMLVSMKDGSFKKIEDVQVGDETLLGGMVLQKLVTLKDWQGDLFDYQGVIVTGSHAVYEDKAFKRVRHSRHAIPANLNIAKVHNLSTEKHIMIIGTVIFADYTETNKTQDLDKSLEILNDEFRATLS